MLGEHEVTIRMAAWKREGRGFRGFLGGQGGLGDYVGVRC